jgi:hypothetical protein
MRRLRALITGLLLLLFVFGQIAVAADDIIIDVENGNLKTGSYNIPLAKSVDRPISVGMEDGNVILVVQTDTGSTIRLNLGQGRVALTTRANSFVRIEQTSTATGNITSGLADQDDGSGNCKICGKTLAAGDHSRFPCGHYVCKVGANHRGGICRTCRVALCGEGDHTVCPRCSIGFCSHDDFACSYRHNPAPTPFETTDPATGEKLYFYLSPDGVFMLGNPSGEKPSEWSPAIENLFERYPSPSPMVTWNPNFDPPLHTYPRNGPPPPGYHWDYDVGFWVVTTPAPYYPLP